jgi:6-phosphogluconolactonase (cycloisomerase 2 family)
MIFCCVPLDNVTIFIVSRRDQDARDVTHVRFGSKADIALGPRHVRFTPKSGH